MTVRTWSALVGLAAAGWQGAPAATATVVVSYSVVSEDDTSNRGSVTLALKAGEVRQAIVWELDCHLDARANAAAAAPGVDQYWNFKADVVAAPDGRPAVRIRYVRIRIAAAGPQPPEKQQLLPLDGTGALAITEFSTRTDCRYDRINLSVTAKEPTFANLAIW